MEDFEGFFLIVITLEVENFPLTRWINGLKNLIYFTRPWMRPMENVLRGEGSDRKAECKMIISLH